MLQCLQKGAEEFLRGVMHDTQVYAEHAKRATVMDVDMRLATRTPSQRARLCDTIEPEPAPAKRRKVKQEQNQEPKKRQVQKTIRQEGPWTLD